MKLLTAAFFGAIMMFLGVLFGALGSHVLKTRISPENLQSFMIAIRYLLFHGIALISLNAFPYLNDVSKGRIALLLIVGIVLFSGSIVLLSTKAIHQLSINWFGPVTPIGGLCLLGGWGYLIFMLGKEILY